MIGRSGERGSGISVLAARHNDDDDIYIYIYIYTRWKNTPFLLKKYLINNFAWNVLKTPPAHL